METQGGNAQPAQPSSLPALPESQPLISMAVTDSGTQESQNLALKADTDSEEPEPSPADWASAPPSPASPASPATPAAVLPVPDEPAPVPADVALKPEAVQKETAQIIANLANVENPSERSLP